MTASLADRIQLEERAGHEPHVAAFRAVAPERLIRVAWILSCSLALTAAEARDIAREVWPDCRPTDDDFDALLRWPFIERSLDGVSFYEGLGEAFRQDFRASEPNEFRRVHEELVKLESTREVAADPSETWFIRGRTAYYLAGVNEEESLSLFGDAFAEPPITDRTDCRMWLASLAVKQESIVRDRSREMSFFRGFRLYVMGARREARAAFDTVLDAGLDDRYAALAGHFAGLLRRRDAPERGIELLHASVDLSERLRLAENEVMARQSLVVALFALSDSAALDQAYRLAIHNLERARSLEDPYLITWCRHTAVEAEWIKLTNHRAHVPPEAVARVPDLTRELLEVADSSFAMGDLETGFIAANDAAQIFRDVGDYSAALETLNQVLDQSEGAPLSAATASRLGKTAGSMFRLARSAHAAIEDVLGRIEDRKNSFRAS